ncbi:MAG: hypothetical protein C3F13_02580 [Anaerolineales bacterium]|nr:MAG: hypothetical protein C3F13_02580 [Anaerolineales bacterium]
MGFITGFVVFVGLLYNDEMKKSTWFLLVAALLLTSCGSGGDAESTAIAQHVAETLTAMPTSTATLTVTPSETPSPTFTFTITPSETPSPTSTPTPKPVIYLPTATLAPNVTCYNSTSLLGLQCTICMDQSGNITSNNCGF